MNIWQAMFFFLVLAQCLLDERPGALRMEIAWRRPGEPPSFLSQMVYLGISVLGPKSIWPLGSTAFVQPYKPSFCGGGPVNRGNRLETTGLFLVGIGRTHRRNTLCAWAGTVGNSSPTKKNVATQIHTWEIATTQTDTRLIDILQNLERHRTTQKKKTSPLYFCGEKGRDTNATFWRKYSWWLRAL